MKSLLLIGTVVATVFSSRIQAQSASKPTPQPSATSTPRVPQSTPPTKLIPDDLLALPKDPSARPSVPTIPQLDEGFKPPPLSPIAENQRRHFEWRRLRNATQNDSDVRAALKMAEGARTDLEKRKLLGRYYDIFYSKMLARATPDMKDYLIGQKNAALNSLPQARVRPDSGLAPPSAALSPSPAPTPAPLFSPPSIMDPGVPGNFNR